MSASKSRLAYADCYELWDRAIDDPKGIRIEMPDYDAAIYMRMRLHQARTLDREANEETYEPGDVLYGRSAYDSASVRIRTIGNKVWLYLEKISMPQGQIEALSEVFEEIPPPPRVPTISPEQMVNVVRLRRI